MRASRPLRFQAIGVFALLGLLLVATGAAPVEGADRGLPDRVVVNPRVLSDHGIVEMHVFEGEPLRAELVAYTGEVVAAVFVHDAGRGLYGDFQRARTDSARAYYADESPNAAREMLRAIMLDRNLTGWQDAPVHPVEVSFAR